MLRKMELASHWGTRLMTTLIKFSVFPHRKLRKRQWSVKFVLGASMILFIGGYLFLNISYSLLYEDDEFWYEDKGGAVDLTNNYFPNEEALLRKGFLVNTTKCHIPNLDIWSSDVKQQPFYDNSEYKCSLKEPRVTYVQENKVIINTSALADLGYSMNSVSCCYKTILRVEEKITKYGKKADKRFRYSRKCKKMDRVTQPSSRYIKVICHSRLLSIESYSYINFHAIPLLPADDSEDLLDKTAQKYEDRIKEKIKFWIECKKNGDEFKDKMNPDSDRLCKSARDSVSGNLPNVLILGIDSTSRMNFRRFMKKSVSLLEEIGATELKGYTKVGHNTLPNFIVSMTSHSLEETESLCFANSTDAFDDCPFIWKIFSDQNYLTAHLEDCPELAIFNFLKTGFVEQPTDIYIRPLMLAMYRYLAKKYTMVCMKYQRPEEMILNFAADLAISAAENSLPFFISTWLTDLTHEHMNSVEVMDDILTQTIEKLRHYQLLDNTFVMVISDHGYRFLPIRRTLSGWYEDKLPAFWMYVPESLQRRVGGLRENLAKNSRSLISPYDVYATLKHILSINTMTINDHDKLFRAGRGISLFSEIPSRSCQEAGIPSAFCACQVQVKFENDHEFIRAVANAAVARVNEELRPATECYRLRLSYVFSSGIIRSNFTSVNDISVTSGYHLSVKDVFLVGFVTTPGKFYFESQVGFDPDTGGFTKVLNFMRADQIKVFPLCVMNLTPILQELCVCRSVSNY